MQYYVDQSKHARNAGHGMQSVLIISPSRRHRFAL